MPELTPEAEIVVAISMEQFNEAIDILATLALVEAGNDKEVIAGLQGSEGGYAADLLRRIAFCTVTIRVSRAYATPRADDRHLRKAFDLLARQTIFDQVAQRGRRDHLQRAVEHWDRCLADPRLGTIKHFRDKAVAHLAEMKMPRPKYIELIEFTRATAEAMELLANGTGVVALGLDSQLPAWEERVDAFWAPWRGRQ